MTDKIPYIIYNSNGEKTMQAFDFINDDKLAGLPAALRERMQQTQQARIDAGYTAKNGVTYRTAEKKDFINAVCDWQEAGKPAAQRAALKAREAELREKGLF